MNSLEFSKGCGTHRLWTVAAVASAASKTAAIHLGRLELGHHGLGLAVFTEGVTLLSSRQL